MSMKVPRADMLRSKEGILIAFPLVSAVLEVFPTFAMVVSQIPLISAHSEVS